MHCHRLIAPRSLILSLWTLLMLAGCDTKETTYLPAAGVPLKLARQRAARIDSVRYTLHFDIPENKSDSIAGQMQLEFLLRDGRDALSLDFAGPGAQISEILAGETPVEPVIRDQHVTIPARYLKQGHNRFAIRFTAGDMSLNRSDEYLYTLLVPDRARTLFPCFDQPDIKARYRLTLAIPEGWSAVANGALEEETLQDGGRRRLRFRETLPISTYLFAFAAGRFQEVTQERGGRTMTMYHRETEADKVDANADAIFDLHDQALRWLEEYTGRPLPFPKLDFVLIPGFQYGGMEHVGAIFYRAPSLMLDASASENERLGRARLIAHETAHMWFGDLVTMKWFNDVWLKEVFANFMAAKAVNPGFPEINHELSFLLSHKPAAYGEDRSEGTHPIQQPLDNLNEAGTLYGRIIYQKAPVVMRQLEQVTGATAFRDGLRTYLNDHAYGNATWDDLIRVLDESSDVDLATWSDVWVKQAGMPVVHYDLDTEEGQIRQLTLIQEKRAANGSYWPQHTEVALLYEDSIARLPADLSGEATPVPAAMGYPSPVAVLPNASPMAYGYFRLDDSSRRYLLDHAATLPDPLLRGAAWLALYEATIRGDLSTADLYPALEQALAIEREPLNRQNLINQLHTIFWKFSSDSERENRAADLENTFWELARQAKDPGTKAAYFRAYQSFMLTPSGVERLYRVWQGDESFPDLPFSERDRIAMAEALALRLPDRAPDILARQAGDIQNPDRRQRFDFIRPALSPKQEVRDSFFNSLKAVENRHYEPWVVDAVGLLHHPLRAEASVSYLQPSLELLQEIQATGDIFFPRQWIGATLSGHRSPEAAAIVRQFLKERPQYPIRLRNKILMAADLLFRASGEEEG